MNEWLRAALSEFVALDGKLLHTLRTLVWPPGELTAEWYRGRRSRYISPFRLYLAAALLFFLAWPQTPWSQALDGFAEGFLAGSGAETAQAAEQATLVVEVILEGLPGLVIIVLVPMFALLLKVLTPGVRPYVGHLVEGLHIHVVAFVLLAAGAPMRVVAGEALSGLLPLALFVVFAIAAVGRVHGLKWWSTTARTLGMLTVYFVGVTLSISVLLAIVAEARGGAL